MARICIIHGVGTCKENGPIGEFASKLSDRTGVECVLHKWEHSGHPPEDARTGPIFSPLRKFTWEVIMDFTYVVANAATLYEALPPASMYIGHSAGGIIAAGSTGVPLVLFGTPLQLVRNVMIKGNDFVPILNVMHCNDPIAAPTSFGVNLTLSGSLASRFNPVLAHTSYWENKRVLTATADWFARYAIRRGR